MGHKVVAIEPFHDNILRIHKASQMENTFSNIILIKNAVSNKRNEIKMLEPDDRNIGAQSLLQHRNELYEKNANNKYLVETILLDDIVPYLPLNSKHKTAIIKIDIEGFEVYAFEHASLLFNTLDIKIVFMEWHNLAKHDDTVKVMQLIEFFYSRKYEPFDVMGRVLLSRNKWSSSWPGDISWRKI